MRDPFFTLGRPPRYEDYSDLGLSDTNFQKGVSRKINTKNKMQYRIGNPDPLLGIPGFDINLQSEKSFEDFKNETSDLNSPRMFSSRSTMPCRSILDILDDYKELESPFYHMNVRDLHQESAFNEEER